MKKSNLFPIPKHNTMRRHTAATINPPNVLSAKASDTALTLNGHGGGGGSLVNLQPLMHASESVRADRESYYPIAGADSAQLGVKKSTEDVTQPGVPAIVVDDEHTRVEIEQVQRKRASIVKKLKEEQAIKEENVNEYLAMTSSLTAANETQAQQHHIKTLFGRREQKSAQVIAQLQQKLDKYDEQLRVLQSVAAAGTAAASLSRRNTVDATSAKVKDTALLSRSPGDQTMAGVTDAAGTGAIIPDDKKLVPPGLSVRAPSDDVASSAGSVGGTSVGSGSAILPSSYASRVTPLSTNGAPPAAEASSLADDLRQRLAKQQNTMDSFLRTFEEFRHGQHAALEQMRVLLEADRQKLETLQAHLLEIGDMRHNDNVILRQNMTDLEEHMEYRLEEHMRDLHELLERCQTRVLKLELSHQQQQQTIMEGFDGSSMRNILAKLLNVVLAIIAVFVVVLSSLVSLLQPCFNSKASLLLSVSVLAVLIAVWYDWRSAGVWNRLLGHSAANSSETSSAAAT